MNYICCLCENLFQSTGGIKKRIHTIHNVLFKHDGISTYITSNPGSVNTWHVIENVYSSHAA